MPRSLRSALGEEGVELESEKMAKKLKALQDESDPAKVKKLKETLHELTDEQRKSEAAFEAAKEKVTKYDAALADASTTAVKLKDKLEDVQGTQLEAVDEKGIRDAERKEKEAQIRLADMQKEERRATLEPYLPTLQAIAKSGRWNTGEDMAFNLQKRADETTMQFGGAYMQQFSEKARELSRTEDDAKRALAISGPDSQRFKDDLAKIKSLKKDLSDADLLKVDKVEKYGERMVEFMNKAQAEGLVVKPVTGE